VLLKLRRLSHLQRKLKFHPLKDAAILLYIVHECDTSKISTLVACFSPSYSTSDRSLVELAWFDSRNVGAGNAIVLEAVEQLQSLQNAANYLRLPRDIYIKCRVAARKELHDEIATFCPAVTSLKLAHENDTDGSSLFQKHTIRHLHLVASDSCLVASNSIPKHVSKLPGLKVLKVSNYTADPCQLSSSSLQRIDVTSAGKYAWVTRCVCPNLRRFVCRGYSYGNGVRPRKENGELDWNAAGEYYAGTTQFDGSLMISNIRPGIVFQGIDVPDDCLVVLQSKW